VAKHRRLGAVADHVQLRGVVRQTATVVATAIIACILVAGLVTVVLAGLDSAKHPAPQLLADLSQEIGRQNLDIAVALA